MQAIIFFYLICSSAVSRLGVWGFSVSTESRSSSPIDTLAASAQRTLNGLRQLWRPATASDDKISYANSPDESYPWKFMGRCIFVPSLVESDPSSLPSTDLVLLNVGGWTLGGTVVLEYDSSPVGCYREWVTLGGLALYPRQTDDWQSFLVGQFGSNLYVSKPQAQTLCETVWGLTAKGADIQLVEQVVNQPCVALESKEEGSGTKGLSLTASGWDYVKKGSILSFKNIGLLWTPTIKAIWTCLLQSTKGQKTSDSNRDENSSTTTLPLNRLRLSGNVRPARFDIRSAPNEQSPAICFGLGLAVEDLVIEISPSIPNP